MIRFQLEGELIQVVFHIRDVAEEVTRNQLLRSQLQPIGSLLYGDSMITYLSMLFLHRQVEGVERMKRVLVTIIDFFFFNLVLAHGFNESISLPGSSNFFC